MIDKLTVQNENALRQSLAQANQIFFSTKTDRPMAEQTLSELYGVFKYEKPRFYIWVDSPKHLLLFRYALKSGWGIQDEKCRDTLRKYFKAPLADFFQDPMKGDLGARFMEETDERFCNSFNDHWLPHAVLGYSFDQKYKNEISGAVITHISGQFHAQLKDKEESVCSQLLAHWLKLLKEEFSRKFFYRIWNANVEYVGKFHSDSRFHTNLLISEFFQFRLEEIQRYLFYRYGMGMQSHRVDPDFYPLLLQIGACCGGWIPYRNFAILSQKPMVVREQHNMLHNYDGPALCYADGLSLWFFNGASVPRWLAETPATELEVEKILQIENAEAKHNAIMKFGQDRFFSKLGGRVLDTKYLFIDEMRRVHTRPGEQTRKIEYQLIRVDLGRNISFNLLKMENPSVEGIWHYEGVPDSCNTVLDAFEFRTGKNAIPVFLS